MISIDDSRPYARPLEQAWAELPAETVRLRELVLSQFHVGTVSFVAATLFRTPPPIHVVELEGLLYVHDGHHRVLVALARGAETISARVWRAP